MAQLLYREITEEDLPKLAAIRAQNTGSLEHWTDRIRNYSQGISNPQKALAPRVLYCACENNQVVAFVAGHLSNRFDCDGELQWIDTMENYRGTGIASNLLKLLAQWFIKQEAYKICVDPGTALARKFYQKNGATNLNDHWMFWKDIRSIV